MATLLLPVTTKLELSPAMAPVFAVTKHTGIDVVHECDKQWEVGVPSGNIVHNILTTYSVDNGVRQLNRTNRYSSYVKFKIATETYTR